MFTNRNKGKLPTNVNHVTHSHLYSVTFSAVDISKYIENLNSNKLNRAHNYHNVSIRMMAGDR